MTQVYLRMPDKDLVALHTLQQGQWFEYLGEFFIAIPGTVQPEDSAIAVCLQDGGVLTTTARDHLVRPIQKVGIQEILE